MVDDKKNELIIRSTKEISAAGNTAKKLFTRMTRDVLAQAEVCGITGARFRVGDYLLREPDYRQVCDWSDALGLPPAELIMRLSAGYLQFKNGFCKDISFFVEDGSIVSMVWDFEHLPIFPNTWQKELMIEALGFSSTPFSHRPGHFQPNLQHLNTLICKSMGISSLDLCHVPRLTTLDCSYNELTELNLSKVPSLSRLNCKWNRLRILDLSNSRELEISHTEPQATPGFSLALA